MQRKQSAELACECEPIIFRLKERTAANPQNKGGKGEKAVFVFSFVVGGLGHGVGRGGQYQYGEQGRIDDPQGRW